MWAWLVDATIATMAQSKKTLIGNWVEEVREGEEEEKEKRKRDR